MDNVPTFQKLSLADKIFNKLFGVFLGLGLGLSHHYVLDVRGRKSGRVYSTPVDVLNLGDKRYLVAPRGETQWVRNARAAGEVTLRKGSTKQFFRIAELDDQAKPPMLKAYLERFHLTVQRFFPVNAGADEAAFAPLTSKYPVFEIVIQNRIHS